MQLRGPDRQPRLGRLRARRRIAPGALAAPLLAALAAGCASSPAPTPAPAGFYHTVRSGDTVYSIARRYGVPTASVIALNGIPDVTSIPIGTRLWIPADGRPPPRNGHAPPRAREPVGPAAQLRLDWPVRGKLTSGFGRRRGRSHQGLDIAARHGSAIRAAAPGKVIFSGRMGAYGRMVVVKHEGHYRTVYAHARQIHVRRGEFVERGQRIASVGTSGNATGPHLHFEVRYRERPVDPLRFLP